MPLKSLIHVSRVSWIVTRLYSTLSGGPGPLKQVKTAPKIKVKLDQNGDGSDAASLFVTEVTLKCHGGLRTRELG